MVQAQFIPDKENLDSKDLQRERASTAHERLHGAISTASLLNSTLSYDSNTAPKKVKKSKIETITKKSETITDYTNCMMSFIPITIMNQLSDRSQSFKE